MFKIKSDVLNKLLEAIKGITDEAKIELTPEGLKVGCVDASQVAMLNAFVPVNAFESYDEGNNGSIALDINQLSTMVSGANGVVVSVEKDKDTGRIIVSYGNTKYNIALIDPSAIKPMPKFPELKWLNKADIEVSDFVDGIKAIKNVGDKFGEMVLISDNTGIRMYYADKMNSAQTDIRMDGMEKAQSTFAIDYLENVLKSIRSCKTVQFEFGVDFPLKIMANPGDMELKWIIAPRMTEE